MRISTFLPHTGVFGGVRRFLELGNAWVALGHEVTLFHPEGTPPSWMEYRGRTALLASAADEHADLAITADPHTYGAFRHHAAERHVYYCVIEGDRGLEKAVRDAGVILAANSGALRTAVARRAGRTVLDGAGGIRLDQFHPDPARRATAPLRVLLNGRRSRPKKGTDLVLEALRGVRGVPFEVILFDTPGPGDFFDPRAGARTPPNTRWVMSPSQQELVELYQSSHLFVAAERKAGWCNTALEALACGAALVCTRSGTRDFAVDRGNALVVPFRHPFFLGTAIRRVLRDPGLRDRLAAAGPPSATPWSWDRLARKLLDQVMAGPR